MRSEITEAYLRLVTELVLVYTTTEPWVPQGMRAKCQINLYNNHLFPLERKSKVAADSIKQRRLCRFESDPTAYLGIPVSFCRFDYCEPITVGAAFGPVCESATQLHMQCNATTLITRIRMHFKSLISMVVLMAEPRLILVLRRSPFYVGITALYHLSLLPISRLYVSPLLYLSTHQLFLGSFRAL